MNAKLTVVSILMLVAFSAYAQVEMNPCAKIPEGMVAIPAGSYFMGCSIGDTKCQKDENPSHEVTVEAFFLDRHEVTNAQYEKCAKAGACRKNAAS